VGRELEFEVYFRLGKVETRMICDSWLKPSFVALHHIPL
jgi:hypothetical protein